MNENEKDSLLTKAALFLLAKGAVIGLASIQALITILLPILHKHLTLGIMLLLFGTSTILWLALVVLVAAVMRKHKREIENLKWHLNLFSQSERDTRIAEWIARESYRHS